MKQCKVVSVVRDDLFKTGTIVLLEFPETHYWNGKPTDVRPLFKLEMSHHAGLNIKQGDTLPLEDDAIPFFRPSP